MTVTGGHDLIDISSPGAHVPVTLEGLLDTDARVARCPLGSPARSALPLRPPDYDELPPDVAKGFQVELDLPSPAVYLLRKAVVLDRLTVTLNGRLVAGSDYLPAFYLVEIPGNPTPFDRLSDPRPSQRIREPVYVPWTWGYQAYGHFLTEMLSRILLIKELYARGFEFPVLVPPSPGFLREALGTFAPELVRSSADLGETRVELDYCLLPVDGCVRGHYHPDTRARIAAAVEALRPQSVSGSDASQTSIFISRLNYRAWSRRDSRLLSNEGELQDVARGFGLEVVEPQELSIREQALLFGRTSLLVGEASSALHNAIFSSRARVISLNWRNHGQTRIAALQSQRLHYLLPARMPASRDPVPLSDMNADRRFTIDPRALEATLSAYG